MRWTILTVVGVGLLLSWLLISSLTCRSCLHDAKRISDLIRIQSELQGYFSKCGVYPGGVAKPDADPRCASVTRPSELAGPLLGFPDIPRDQMTETDYSYCYGAGGDSYALQANLEDHQNPALTQALPAPPAGCTNTVGIVTCDKAKGEFCVGP